MLPAEILQPPPSMWDRLAERIAPLQQTAASGSQWNEPEWEEVAPGICCKLLATSAARDRVTMLVRLAPNVAYPPHTHAGLEELHLLSGELWIDDRKMYPGDYNRGERETGDRRGGRETGCTRLLVTSPSDVFR